MVQEKKVTMVNRLAEMLSRSTIVIVTDYRGLSVSEVSKLRRQLREGGVEYRVVKNTLARFAAEKAGKGGLSRLLEGPTALAFGYGDAVASAKVLAEYRRSAKATFAIRGGLLDGQVLTSQEVLELATLPPREVLLAKLLGIMSSPLFSLMNALSANLRGLAAVLQSRIKSLEKSG